MKKRSLEEVLVTILVVTILLALFYAPVKKGLEKGRESIATISQALHP